MIRNLLFFLKNLIFNRYNTPKEIREFNCAFCGKGHIFPITSKDYLICNDCWDMNIGEEE